MAQIKEQKSIPESITLDGVTYSVRETPELQQFIQAISSVEKAKLYSQMDSIKEQIKSLQGVEIEGASPIDVEKIVENLKGTFVTKDDLKGVLSDSVKEVVQPILDATKYSKESELSAYREKLITENAATCIPDIVKGNSKEELDVALKESIRLRAAYPSPVSQPVKEVLPNGGGNNNKPTPDSKPFATQTPPAPTDTTQIPPTPQIPAPSASNEPTGIKNMSVKEFASRRGALKEQLESMYGRG